MCTCLNALGLPLRFPYNAVDFSPRAQYRFALAYYMFESQSYLFFGCGVPKYVVYSNHFGKNSAIAERVAQGNQPRCGIA